MPKGKTVVTHHLIASHLQAVAVVDTTLGHLEPADLLEVREAEERHLAAEVVLERQVKETTVEHLQALLAMAVAEVEVAHRRLGRKGHLTAALVDQELQTPTLARL